MIGPACIINHLRACELKSRESLEIHKSGDTSCLCLFIGAGVA